MARWTCSPRSVVAFILLTVFLGPVGAELHSESALAEDVAQDEEVALIQRTAHEHQKDGPGPRDLVLMHVPYNFGHTIENVAMFGSGVLNLLRSVSYMVRLGGIGDVQNRATWDDVNKMKRSGGEVWGHLNPDLQGTNEATGCPTFYAPPKYWPEELAAKYFGNKTRFGMLRDPYERLVAFFRGSLPGYGGSYPKFLETCDVNGAVKQMMQEYISGNNPFRSDCTFVPQAEYFEGKYGIQLPVNNRQFPSSMNEVFVEHGYDDFQIHSGDVLHVTMCPEVWAGDLDNETRALVRQVYAKDFDLLCKHFGYCDREENACIWQVGGMCPQRVIQAGYRG